MSRLGLVKSVVYHGEACLGELDVVAVKDQNFQFPNNEIRIHHIMPSSERCSPLSVIQTVSSFCVRCKLESSAPVEQIHLINLHASCFHESKTAVVLIGNEEIHLVAMPSKEKKFPCFWCFAVPLGLYSSCLGMLNMRCLAIVFDLDETLIVANTMKSFEDRIEALRAWIARETDPMRISGMTAEMKRYTEDRLLLKQYTESDVVVDNGKMYKVQLEEVPPSSDTNEKLIRPVIRLQEKNIVLTRINPEVRDTSVLVRLRPAWEDLRIYLTAKGRKRFEVYVCTMAERDYALEMWRLLDPESHLISLKQLSYRVVCVKSGSRKSLLNVFQDGVCHPKMAMVIDDRSKVWEDRDQSRVHVVPPFTPYYAPQAETANAVPVLCVARNVACNVRACFFKEFDEILIRKICEISYEDDVMNLPPTPDVSNYLMSEDTGFVTNGNGTGPFCEGMSGAEVEERLHQSSEKNGIDTAPNSIANSAELKPEFFQSSIAVNPSIAGPTAPSVLTPVQRPSLLGNPVRREVRNSGQPPILSRIPVPVPSSSAQPQGGWLVEEDSGRPGVGNRSTVGLQEADPFKSDKPRVLQNPFGHSTLAAPSITQTSQVKREEAFSGPDIQKQGPAPGNHASEVGVSQNSVSSNNKGFHGDAGKLNLPPSHLSIGVLQEIGRRCSSKVEFRSVVSTSKDLQFSLEVLFTGEKIGVGMGKTRKDAQQQAAENALRSLAEKYLAYIAPRSGVDQDIDKVSLGNENGFLWDIVSPGSSEAIREDGLPKERSPEATEVETSASNQQVQKRDSSPRLPQSFPRKRTKEP